MEKPFPYAFAGYGRMVMVGLLARKMGISWKLAYNNKSRSVRVLWYLYQLQDSWVTINNITNLGGCSWKTASYIFPDMVKDQLVDVVVVGKQTKYKISAIGKKMVEAADIYIQELIEENVQKIADFKASKISKRRKVRKGIKKANKPLDNNLPFD